MDFSTPAKFIPSVFLNTGTTRPEREEESDEREEGSDEREEESCERQEGIRERRDGDWEWREGWVRDADVTTVKLLELDK